MEVDLQLSQLVEEGAAEAEAAVHPMWHLAWMGVGVEVGVRAPWHSAVAAAAAAAAAAGVGVGPRGSAWWLAWAVGEAVALAWPSAMPAVELQ